MYDMYVYMCIYIYIYPHEQIEHKLCWKLFLRVWTKLEVSTRFQPAVCTVFHVESYNVQSEIATSFRETRTDGFQISKQIIV